MSLLCYVTKQLQGDASRFGIAKSDIEKFAKKVEQRQSLAGFDHFPPPCLTKKKIFGFNYRLIAAEKRVGEHLVVVFLRLVIRGGNEYADFLRDPPTWAVRCYDAELTDDKVAAWVTERTQVTPPPPAPKLSDTERTFLWTTANSEERDDVIICETEEWVNGVTEPRIADRLIRLPELILEAISRVSGEVHVLRSPADDRLAILAFNVAGTNQCVLLSVGYAESDEELLSRSMSWSTKLSGADSEHVLRHSRRSYPSIICCDDDMWIAVEKDSQANLALSFEEADILRASNLQDVSRAAFPLFINGRAGSGKSTLLQYLFAQCLIRWANLPGWESAKVSRPLYFASSPELLKVAKDVVRSLLRANHEHLLGNQRIDDVLFSSLDECFQDSLRFFSSQAGEHAETRFRWANYVNYATFRRRWMGRFGKEKKAVHEYGPQISWHVIRGFIKGMSIDDVLAREDYDELPEEERTVSREVFEAVHDRVWSAWYEPLCRTGDAWDSQDLVSFLLHEERLPATHVAVFCDESQDFTRLELEAIYRCSLFSDRQIDFLSLKRVPFVFAGDPFQTLNPTGFRWESVRAAFTERILRSLYRFSARAEVPQLNYQELTFNYRSSPRIVHLCNSIQAVRASLFGHRSLRPQSTWQLGGQASAPVFCEKGDTQLENAIRDQSDLVLIVPCEEGEEIEYVANDPYLKALVQSDEDGTPRNVLSAARAKGLEFLRVAMYGWASRDEASSLARMMRSLREITISVDKRLGLEYFMNNLYVAASRARRRLFVIDEKEALNDLWWFAADEQNLSHIIQDLPQRDVWTQNAGVLVRGVPESFREDRDDPRAIAERFEREGLSKEDSYLLKQANLQYAIAGDMVKSHECRAMADVFDGRFKEAGENFKKAGNVERSIDAYWRGKLLTEIAECLTTNADFARFPRCRVAAFVAGTSQTGRECRSLFEHLLENAKVNEGLRADLRSDLWRHAFHKTLENTLGSKDKPKVMEFEDARGLADLTMQLETYGVQFDDDLTARVLFFARRYEDARKRLTNDTSSDLYRDAVALALIEQASSVEHKYSEAESRSVAEYYYRQGQIEAATRFYREIRDAERVLACLRESLNSSPQVVDAVLANAIVTLVSKADWEALISLLTNGHPDPTKRAKWAKPDCAFILDRIRQGQVVCRAVVPALARSPELSSADGKAQQVVSEFLAREFLRADSTWPWQKDLPREIAGAAIERAGRDIDALKFYENWREARVSQNEREYAERRWVVCKLRQARREEREGFAKKAGAYRQDAARLMGKNGWLESDVADGFPELSVAAGSDRVAPQAREPIAESPLRVSHTPLESSATRDKRGKLGRLSYRIIGSKGWINIEADDGLCARVLVRERKVTSEDVSLVPWEEIHVKCEEWGLVVRWMSDSSVQFVLGTSECNISVGEGG